jgi:hypothetical protein
MQEHTLREREVTEAALKQYINVRYAIQILIRGGCRTLTTNLLMLDTVSSKTVVKVGSVL